MQDSINATINIINNVRMFLNVLIITGFLIGCSQSHSTNIRYFYIRSKHYFIGM